jgi:hypothetical protein
MMVGDAHALEFLVALATSGRHELESPRLEGGEIMKRTSKVFFGL